MNFNETTNRSGIIQQIERLTDLGVGYISGNSDLLKDFTVYTNIVNNELVTIIHKNSGAWQYDDSGNTDLPIATTDLVSGTYRYGIPSTALTIKRAEIKDRNGAWIKLKPLTIEKEYLALGDLETQSGVPTHYMLYNDTIQLYPKPDYASSDGLKVYYDRTSVNFASTDTTKTPGILSNFHYLYPLGVAIQWLKIKQPQSPSLTVYMADYEKGKEELADSYASRWKDNTPTLITKKEETFE